MQSASLFYGTVNPRTQEHIDVSSLNSTGCDQHHGRTWKVKCQERLDFPLITLQYCPNRKPSLWAVCSCLSMPGIARWSCSDPEEIQSSIETKLNLFHLQSIGAAKHLGSCQGDICTGRMVVLDICLELFPTRRFHSICITRPFFFLI